MKLACVMFLIACGSSAPAPAPVAAAPTKADQAVTFDQDGQKLMTAGDATGAEKKFIAAYNNDPKAQYCYDLCTAETQLGKFQLALNACKKVGLHDPTPELKAKADTQMQTIRDQAKAANVELE
jgi:hypothetical protein